MKNWYHTVALSLACGGVFTSAAIAADSSSAVLREPISTAHRVTLLEALDNALANNPRTASARAQLGVTIANLTQAKILPNPAIYIDNQYQFTYKLGVAFNLEPPWKLVLRRAAAKQQITQTDLDIARQLWLFRGEVRRIYAEASIAAQMSDIRGRMLGVTERLATVAKDRFEGGDVPKLDVHRADLAVAQAEMQLEQAQIAVTQATEQLNILLGQPQRAVRPDAWDVSNSPLIGAANQLPSLDALLDTAVKNRLELKLAQQSKSVNEANLKVAYGNILPSPRFVVGRMTEDKINSPLNRKTTFFQATIDLPIFDFQQGQISRFRALRSQFDSDYFAQRNLVAAQVALAYRRVESALARIHKYRDKLIKISETITSAAELGYRMGQSDITSTLVVQQDNINIQSQFLDSVLAYQLAFNDLEQAAGVPLQ